MTIEIRDKSIEIRPINQDDLDAVLAVYQQCEDFLALGPVSAASMEMVLKDIQISQHEGGVFCGICTADEKMIGIIDYIPSNFNGDPQIAFLSLLMIALPFRKQGIGRVVVEAIENEIRKNTQVVTILTGVQVKNTQALHFCQMNGYRIVSGPELQPDQTTTYILRKDINQRV